MAVKSRTRKRLGGFEADAFAGSPFLRNFSAFVRGTVVWGKTHEDQQHPSILLVDKENPAGFTSLSPEVQARLKIVKKIAEATRAQSRKDFTASDGARWGTSVVGEDGHIDWTRVAIAPEEAEEDDRVLVEGARLAVSCDSWLRRRPNSATHPCFEADSLRGVSFVAEWIAEGSDEEAYVALCICFTVLEKTLFDMHHDKAESGRCPYRETYMPRTNCSSPVARQNEDVGGVVDSIEASRDNVATAGRSVMILRDLIASPMVKAALPKQMSTVLRLLLLPLSFNIRNLVWHGFLAPHELPRELASLVLLVTISVPISARERAESSPSTLVSFLRTIASEMRPTFPEDFTAQGQWVSEGNGDEHIETTTRGDLFLPPASYSHASPWALDSFDDRLKCPPALGSAVGSILSKVHISELRGLVRRSAFVVPGREDAVMLALGALRERRYALFLVAILPILEHGLRCLFSCANDCPEHFFAHLRQYYSTLDGFGQRARHQLLLDQEISGDPGRPNLLLPTLGHGLSACLLDLFMMNAGPNLRGKIAHAEIDVSTAFIPPSMNTAPCDNACGGFREGGTGTSHPGVVTLTAGAFVALCSRYDPVKYGARIVARSREERVWQNTSGPSSSSSSGEFREAQEGCEACCSEWVPRFHPHEMLEADLQACHAELGSLASALVRRAVSVERLPGECDLARMSVIATKYHHEGLVTAEECQDADGSCARESKGNVGGEGGARERESTLRGDSEVPLLLTVIDYAQRLIPLDESEIAEGSSSSGGREGRETVKHKKAKPPNGVFPALHRAVWSIREHATVLAGRFRRLATADDHETASTTPQSLVSSVGSLASQSTAGHESLVPRKGGTSAFNAYMHSLRCTNTVACGFECFERERTIAPGENLMSGSEGGEDKITLSAIGCRSSPSPGTPTRRKWKASRISPITNVITASSLPQIACIGGLCRLCAKVARSLRERLLELEALLGSGKAPSAKRRAYASTLLVAPTLLSFLAITAAAVEAFVIEWNLLHESREGTRSERDQAVMQAAAHACEGAEATAAFPEGEDEGTKGVPLLGPPSVMTRRSASKDVRTRLAFLRRLAAINGALSLCVTKGRAGPRAGESRPSSSSECLADRDGSGVGAEQRKGYAQALVELATFLETNAARKGFAGC